VDVFIIGSKGIPARYGGFETFVHKLTEKRVNENIKYHVSCLASNNEEFQYNNTRCFNIKVPNIGSAKAIIYDIKALMRCTKYIKQNKLKDCVIYILACRIGFFLTLYCSIFTNMGVKLFVNPDGHEWMRSKWNKFIKAYWRSSERLMVKHADLIICDSLEIQRYIKQDYNKFNPKTTYIAYGAEMKAFMPCTKSAELLEWYKKCHVKEFEYYLIIGRFVPENNFEIIIREFMLSKTKKDLVIVANVENNKFYRELLEKTSFNKDRRIKFAGTLYDVELLTKVREKAYAYFHGHEVGGTNPSLLEALASTKINILLNVAFNEEVAENAAVYFSKDKGNLANLINEVDKYDEDTIKNFEVLAKKRIKDFYTWEKIVACYEKLFLKSYGEGEN
jgi:rhamnosyltransferase